jgi:hypothetical protein
LWNLVCHRLATRVEQQARQFRVLNGKRWEASFCLWLLN